MVRISVGWALAIECPVYLVLVLIALVIGLVK